MSEKTLERLYVGFSAATILFYLSLAIWSLAVGDCHGN